MYLLTNVTKSRDITVLDNFIGIQESCIGSDTQLWSPGELLQGYEQLLPGSPGEEGKEAKSEAV